MAFNISQPIDVRSKCANIDYLYGPYNSVEEAFAAIDSADVSDSKTGYCYNCVNAANYSEFSGQWNQSSGTSWWGD